MYCAKSVHAAPLVAVAVCLFRCAAPRSAQYGSGPALFADLRCENASELPSSPRCTATQKQPLRWAGLGWSGRPWSSLADGCIGTRARVEHAAAPPQCSTSAARHRAARSHTLPPIAANLLVQRRAHRPASRNGCPPTADLPAGLSQPCQRRFGQSRRTPHAAPPSAARKPSVGPAHSNHRGTGTKIGAIIGNCRSLVLEFLPHAT